jgi:2,3-bisphosphoglycerate-dependent phosphoglycerate mutase
VTIDIVFETHSVSEDNETGHATGWLPGRLSTRGRDLAAELGRRRGGDDFAAVFTSDLRRAVETAEVAFGQSDVPILHDWRLRECDYGRCNGMPAAQMHSTRREYLDTPYPDGESWRQAVHRVVGVLDDLPSRWSGCRLLIIGHVATRWALDHTVGGVPLEELVHEQFVWREGWHYRLD